MQNNNTKQSKQNKLNNNYPNKKGSSVFSVVVLFLTYRLPRFVKPANTLSGRKVMVFDCKSLEKDSSNKQNAYSSHFSD